MERNEDLEDAEIEDRVTEDGGGGSNIYDEQGSARGSAEFLLLTPPLPSFLLLSAPTTDCCLRF